MKRSHTVDLGRIRIGPTHPLTIIAGPCAIESASHALMLARELKMRCDAAGHPFIFKASFDKANRTSADSFRGHGIAFGLDVLRRVRDEVGVPTTTDVHLPEHQMYGLVNRAMAPAAR